METGQIAKALAGDKLYQERARRALPILVRQALANQHIYYSDLATELGMPNPRNLNFVLGSIGQTLQQLSDEWKEIVPPINCLVVNKATGLPGEGVGVFIDDDDKHKFSKLPRKQQRIIIDVQLHKIFTYTRWLDVLKYLGLEYKSARDYSSLLNQIHLQHGSGESLAHKEFKEYISRNPQVIGLNKSVARGKIEFSLPSGDVADILFIIGGEWVITEAKSLVSDTADVYRGLYQCVKYQAVAEAFQCEKGLYPSCRVVLAVENTFPSELIEIKNILGVEVIDRITR